MTVTEKNLFNLDELTDYKVAEGYSDVRGWEVKDANDRVVGKVDHLLVSKSAERVVYLDVEVDESLIEEGFKTYKDAANGGVHEFLNKEGENHLIIPIGMAKLDKENKIVNTDKIDSATFSKAKRFKKGDVIDFEYEMIIVGYYMGDHTIHGKNTSGGFYDREEFNYLF
ncbi:PRC-barrel domain-containing protein [Lacihabitans sp. LS3-19]|uniref:PRC-barrel domain-containing protein n=1 Tax=Lacihabitans sp. LS3-19 TaxID=2487335 RepID=UPI0020CE4D53|nr:PRC-barrel domain-containing protein [Lacihabitans sp. LS3-19]